MRQTAQKYKTYPKYKPSGLEWIGEIPEGWEVRKLKWISLIQNSNVDKKKDSSELSVLLCNYVDVYKNEFITNDIDFMEATASLPEIKKFNLKKDDVIITKDSEDWNDIAVAAYCVSNDYDKIICGYHLAQIRPREKIISGKYLFRLFQSYGINTQFKVKANGITRFGLNLNSITSTIFILPPLPEQTAIADFLDRETEKIDRASEKQRKLIELLKEKRSALITHAVTKGLDPNAKMKPSGIEWIGEIPVGWEVRKIKWTTNFIKSGEGIKKENLTEHGIYPVYGGNGLIGFCDLHNHRGPIIIIGRVGALCGNVHYIENEVYITDNALIIDILQFIKIKYYYFLLLSLNLNDFASQNAQPLITGTLIKNIMAPLPPLPEQSAIADFLDRETAKIDELIKKIEKQIELFNEYRQSLITAAVTGKIDLREDIKINKKQQEATDDFREAILFARIVCMISDPKFASRFCVTKMVYFAKRFMEQNVLNQYDKKAAGPYNPQTRYKGGERIALQNGYIQTSDNRHFSAGKNASAINVYKYEGFDNALSWVKKEMKYETNEKLELLSTVDYASLELMKSYKNITIDNIILLIKAEPEWAPKMNKKIFTERNIENAIDKLHGWFAYS